MSNQIAELLAELKEQEVLDLVDQLVEKGEDLLGLFANLRPTLGQ